MITELTLIKRHGVTMTRAEVCEALHVAPNTLRNWVSTGRFPRQMHDNAKEGPVWATQVVARYIDDLVTQAA
jgi:hypothetical protein